MVITEHLAAGILIANASDKIKSPKFTIISIFSSILADIPILFLGGPGEIDYLSHRIYTHSLILSPIYAFIPIFFGYFFFKASFRNNIIRLYLISIISFLSHIFIDFLTPYGVQLFYPFSKTIYSLDFFHSFDPVFISISLCIILIFTFKIIKRKYFNKTILILFSTIILIYSVYTGLAKAYNYSSFSSFIGAEKIESNYVTTVPRTFWRWKGIAEDSVRRYVILTGSNGLVIKTYEKNIKVPSDILESKDYAKFIEYARFPTIIKQREVFNFINLVYSPNSYCLTIKLDSEGVILSSRLTGYDLFDKY